MTDAPLPERIGPFRVLRLLGEGGMGRVYLAEQETPRREVALKVLAGAAASSEFHRRFQRESELLATLEHPGIARLYSAGSAQTPAGPVPFLAMEYVRGADLLTHARERGLAQAQRLALIAQVSRAVHYAHTRGVIHRDLKPANILVDEHGQAKVLDFGVAHVTGGDGATQMTQAGEFLGTVPYTPLEQLAAGAGGVDPRWDVYALGVIAYELLSGALPYPGLSKATVLSALREVLAAAPVRLSKPVPDARGDLETIVMKAMAPEPGQRYASAAEFAADIERFLQQRPIDARPPTARYVLSLFVRRHKALAAGGALALGAIVAGAAVSVRYALSEASARHQTEAVNEFMVQMLTSADPDQMRGAQLTVREVLDGARVTLSQERGLPAPVAATLHRTLGTVYIGVGAGEAALAELEQARALFRDLAGVGALDTLRAELGYATALLSMSRPAEALSQLDAMLTHLPVASGEAQRVRLETLGRRAEALQGVGRSDEAEAALRAAVAEAVATTGAAGREALELQATLGMALRHLGRLPEAVAVLEEVIARRTATLGSNHPRTLNSRNELGVTLTAQGEPQRALQVLEEAAAGHAAVLGARHPSTLAAQNNLFQALHQAGRLEEAAALAAKVTAGCRELLGPTHAFTIAAINNYAWVQEDRKQFQEAEALYRESIAAAESRFGADHPQTLNSRNNFTVFLVTLNRIAEAETIAADVYARAVKVAGAEHPVVANFGSNWGGMLARLGKTAQARAVLEPSHAVLLKANGPAHPHTRHATDRLAQVYRTLGMDKQAAALTAAPVATP